MGTAAGAPKQFIELQTIPIYVWSLSTLLNHPAISRAVIAAPPAMVATVGRQLGKYVPLLHGKRVDLIPGGDTRQKSVYLGLQKLRATPVDYVLVHDAARPFLTPDLVDRVITGVIKYGACTTGIPCSDTIKRISGEQVLETVSRDDLALVQTPQAARYDWLLAAHEKCEREGHATTDDAAVLEFAGHRIGIVRGASSNIKITEPGDLVLAKALASIVLADRL
jgi:2-C-methyl-D-erythritol 4-phosphate cytidylyltransferase